MESRTTTFGRAGRGNEQKGISTSPYRHGRQTGRGMTRHQSTGGDRVAQALGWFSIGLGLAQIFTPRRLARIIGVSERDGTPTLMRVIGVREIFSGLGLLALPGVTGWLWSRVGGDIMDLFLLGRAYRSKHANRGRVAATAAAVTGVSMLDIYDSLRVPSRTPAGVSEKRAIQVKSTITVNRPPEEVYQFWRGFQNFPRFMNHLESVQVTGEGRSHWKAKAPAGTTVEWDAEMTTDRPNEMIAWQSIEGADVANAGSVRFEPAPGGRGTIIRVEFKYDVPGGKLGATIAKLFGEEPKQQVEDDLRAFKQVIETGEVVRSEGSIRGRMKQRPAQPHENSME